MRQRAPREIFISHSHGDEAFAVKLTAILRKNKIKFWYSPKHIVGAEQWHDEIGKALNRCDWFLVILSPNAVKSEWVRRECVFALTENRYKGRIIPVLFKTCRWKKLSWTLGGFQWVKFKKDYKDLALDILKSWQN